MDLRHYTLFAFISFSCMYICILFLSFIEDLSHWMCDNMVYLPMKMKGIPKTTKKEIPYSPSAACSLLFGSH